MKKIIFILIAIKFSLAFGQSYSTINFATELNDFAKGPAFTFYLNDKKIGVVQSGENLEYKIYSEGRMTLFISTPGWQKEIIINISPDSTYYYLLYSVYTSQDVRITPVKSEDGLRYMAANPTTLKAAENIDDPIIEKNPEGGPK